MTSQMPVTTAEMLQVTLLGGSGGEAPLALQRGGWMVLGSFARDEAAAAGTAVHRPPCSQGDTGHPEPRGCNLPNHPRVSCFHVSSAVPRQMAVRNVANDATTCKRTAPGTHLYVGFPREEKLPKALRCPASGALQLQKAVA